MQSRLSRNLEQKTKRKFYLTVLGTIIILFLMIKFGIPALVNISLFLGNSKSSTNSSQTKNNQFVAVPFLDPQPSATNSASINISGTASSKQTIKLFVNDTFSDSTDTKDDGSFIFKNVSLQQGSNIIKVKAKQGDSESDFSDGLDVTYKNSQPSLTIDSPSDSQSFSKDQSQVNITGKTDPEVKVTVNDFWAITDDKGNYSYNLHLQNGDNQIKVDATDPAGNKTEKSIKVTYSQ